MSEATVRGEHAHMKSENVLIPLKGTCTVRLNDSKQSRDFLLDNPDSGLYIAPETWLELRNFSPDSIVLVLSSTLYDTEEIIDDYKLFKKAMSKKKELAKKILVGPEKSLLTISR